MIEHLKSIQSRLAAIASDVQDVKADLRGVKGHMASFMQSEVAQDGAIAALQASLERIERRLGLTN